MTVGLLGILLVAIGVFSILAIGSRNKDEGVVIKRIDEIQTNIFVDVGGAVEKPGVYKLVGNSRVNDALIIAGGLGLKADREWVEKNLNLAAKLVDGQKIYIPEKGEGEDSNKVSPRSNLQGETLKGININTASSAELDTLWGVGPATAQKIIDNRPYGGIEELLTKKVIKSNVFEAIKDKITVY